MGTEEGFQEWLQWVGGEESCSMQHGERTRVGEEKDGKDEETLMHDE